MSVTNTLTCSNAMADSTLLLFVSNFAPADFLGFSTNFPTYAMLFSTWETDFLPPSTTDFFPPSSSRVVVNGNPFPLVSSSKSETDFLPLAKLISIPSTIETDFLPSFSFLIPIPIPISDSFTFLFLSFPFSSSLLISTTSL
uniref:Uncharacterized protein n=1 Tax=Opuntia streptacantha TaxID=393608 RepID=A0A7C9AE86_OPUST